MFIMLLFQANIKTLLLSPLLVFQVFFFLTNSIQEFFFWFIFTDKKMFKVAEEIGLDIIV